MDIAGYIQEVLAVHAQGTASEHSYRPALTKLFASVDPTIKVQNEPKQLINVGAPDFSFSTDNAAIGHCEAKTLGHDLLKRQGYEKGQFERYSKGLPNLIYTNCFDFMFYEDGKLTQHITIAEDMFGWQPKPEAFGELEAALKNFVTQRPQTIRSTEKLAKFMAAKAQMIKEAMFKSLVEDNDDDTPLASFHKAFREMLIHDISREEFADVYAETVTYGMFAARLNDPTKESFSRYEAFDLLPATNPFLKKLFFHIAGQDLDDRLRWIIDQLAEVFLAVDPAYLHDRFAKRSGRSDPFIHFYEDFLKEYNPKKRQSRGVWYTPEPVVNFIVRAVDDVLKTEFNLPLGLADNSKITVDWDTGETNKKGKAVTIKKEMHRVQILDPATGTGTFLAEAITQIAARIKSVAPGSWTKYIEDDLVPRIHGFELLMASYAMCHMKLHMVLQELGYNPPKAAKRLGVYLTNSLEQGERDVRDLFGGEWLSEEARGANTIKRDMPIMCVIGNPPYSGESSNKGDWIMGLMDAYKKEPGGVEKLKERNPKWINNDYMKFIRFSQHMIEKNGEGILGFITSNSYLDSSTFRGMRWNLLKTFDKIYILDLHGNSKRKEVSEDGSIDKNVFDITEGVSIIIAVLKKAKSSPNDSLARVLHKDLIGKRQFKYDELWSTEIKSKDWSVLENRSPEYVFANYDYDLQDAYRKGFSIDVFFPKGVMGFQTHRDHFAIANNIQEIIKRCDDLRDSTITDEVIRERYDLKDSFDWNVPNVRTIIKGNSKWEEFVTNCAYRPLDVRSCYLDKVAMDRPRPELIKNVIGKDNILIGIGRQGSAVGPIQWCLATVSIFAMDANIFRRGGVRASPLYLYPDEQDLDQTRRINFDPKLWKKLKAKAKHKKHGVPDEVQTFDYIYGVLHCPAYRDTYKEFLKIDFPRIPWPSTPDEFWDVSAKGKSLRELHLMQDAAIGERPYPFMGEGDNAVEKPIYEDGKVWINKHQYFDAVPDVSWGFYIGGYQPAQKWLKDRKGRELSFDDIMHYQKIIKILAQTDRIMQTIVMKL